MKGSDNSDGNGVAVGASGERARFGEPGKRQARGGDQTLEKKIR